MVDVNKQPSPVNIQAGPPPPGTYEPRTYTVTVDHKNILADKVPLNNNYLQEAPVPSKGHHVINHPPAHIPAFNLSPESQNVMHFKFRQPEKTSPLQSPNNIYMRQGDTFFGDLHIPRKFPSPPTPVKTKKDRVLPPCRVCGDKASGYHFGVNTCEACKIFFRRCLMRKKEFRCNNDNDCLIDPGNRLACACCRFAKCLFVGMSKKGIRRGRYTLEKRMNTIIELKQLGNQENMQEVEVPPQGMELSPVKPPRDEFEEMSSVASQLADHSKRTTPYTKELMNKIPTLEKEYKDYRKGQEQLFGITKPMSNEEYDEIVSVTGIDIDGRKKKYNEHYMRLHERVEMFVDFAKTLPGFQQLHVDDQLALVKKSGFEWWMLIQYPAINTEEQVYTCPCGDTWGPEDLRMFNTDKFIEYMFHTADVIKRVDWTEEEIALLKAILIMSTDGCGELHDQARIEKLQEYLVKVLENELKKNHPDEPAIFLRAITTLCDIRSTSHEHEKSCANVFTKWPELDYPPLFLEFLAG